MSNQPENENQQTVSAEELREYMLTEIEASKQAIAELSDEQLEEIVGGAGESSFELSRPNPFQSPSRQDSISISMGTDRARKIAGKALIYGGSTAGVGTLLYFGAKAAIDHNKKH